MMRRIDEVVFDFFSFVFIFWFMLVQIFAFVMLYTHRIICSCPYIPGASCTHPPK